MSEVIKLNYPQMQEMAEQCIKLEQRLQETVQLGRSIAQELQGGALIGDVGEAFAATLNGKFSSQTMRLSQKFGEIAKDIKSAIADMQASDKSAGGLF